MKKKFKELCENLFFAAVFWLFMIFTAILILKITE